MLNKDNTVFVLVDVQGNLAGIMHDKQQLFANIHKLIKSLKILNIPIIWLEQYPDGIGETIPLIASLLKPLKPISKMSFSGYDNPEFKQTLEQTGRKQVILAGIESHVCVYQTAMGLDQANYEVEVICDAVSSRTQSNKQIALLKMQKQGINLTSTEMVLFELLKTAEDENFREIIKLIK